MGIFRGVVDWAADIYHYSSIKFRTPSKTPPYIAAEVDNIYPSLRIRWFGYDDHKFAKKALQISWVRSNIERIASEVSSAGFEVYKGERKGKRQDINHPLELLLRNPNEFFDGVTLLRYLIYALYLSPDGAYWYLAPDTRTGEIREIWPVPVGKLKPVKHKSKFISHYEYDTGGEKPIKINPKYICRFYFPHPYDLWRSLTPLETLRSALSVYDAISQSQLDLYGAGRGVPLSVLSLEPNMSEADFARARERIKEDWGGGSRIAVVRAGSLSVQNVGMANKELETVSSQSFTRDEIDAAFMGFAWRSLEYSSADALREVDKHIKEAVIYPLHKMLAGQIGVGIILPWYGDEYYGEFEDVRAQDRSILIQERTIYWGAMTLDEARADLGLPEIEYPEELDDIGALPYRLATDTTFVLNYYGITKARDYGEKPPEIGNLPESQDQEQMTNQLAQDGVDEDENSIDVEEAVRSAIIDELKRYKTVLVRTWRKSGSTESILARKFDTDIIPVEIMETIKSGLAFVEDEEGIHSLFRGYLD